MRSRFFGMEKRFNCSKDALAQTKITFWFYIGSIPIIIFLFMLPFIQAGRFTFSPYSLVYIVIIAFLMYFGYRSMLVMQAVKNSYCIVEGDRVYGVSTPNPYQKGVPFDIQKSEILGVGKTMISTGGMRSQNALQLNTQNQKIVLLAVEQMDELKDLLISD